MSLIDLVKKTFNIQTLFSIQEKAIKNFVEQDKSCIIATETGTGKTLIGYAGLLKALYYENAKAIYTTPLRALSRQKALELQSKLKDKKVVLSTGDYVNFEQIEEEIKDCDVLVCTYERLDSLTRKISEVPWFKEWLERVSWTIIDELHMLGEPKRGARLEGTIARLKLINPNIKIIGLSSSIPNVKEIASWLNAEYIKSSWRPIPLRREIVLDHGIGFISMFKTKIQKIISEGGNILIFTTSRRDCVETAKMIRKFIQIPLKDSERMELKKITDELKKQSMSRQILDLCDLILHGVAYHHAGLPRFAREIVEDAFAKRLIKVVVATTTLAYGLNFPARMVIVKGLKRYNPEIGDWDWIPKYELKNLIGRAGRYGLDREGYAYIYVPYRDRVHFDFILEYYDTDEVEPVISKLTDEDEIEAQVLATLVAFDNEDPIEISKKFLANTLAYTHVDVERKVKEVLNELREYDVVDENYHVTEFGRLVSRLYIYPATGYYFRDRLQLYSFLTDYGELKIDLVLSIISNAKEFGRVAEDIEAIKYWIEGFSEDVIYSKFDIEMGRLYYLIETAEWLTYSLGRIAEYLGKKREGKKLITLSKRIRYGVPEELIGLCEYLVNKQNMSIFKARTIALSRKHRKASENQQKLSEFMNG